MTTTLNATTSNGLVATPDNSGTIAIQSNGTTQLTISAAGAYGQLKSGTETATTSGTYVDFTGLPSWVKRITMLLNGVSISGSANVTIQLGTASGPTTTGYKTGSAFVGGSMGATGSSNTLGFQIYNWNTSANLYDATFVFCLFGSNTWICNATMFEEGNPNYQTIISGKVVLGATLDRIRLTTSNGTDTFDAGSVNILYEG